MRLQVRGDLSLQRRHQHPARSLAGDLVELGSPVRPVVRRLVADDLQHGCRLLPPARQGAAVDQAGGYAAGVTGSTIHNFRSYLLLLVGYVLKALDEERFLGRASHDHRVARL